MIIAGAIILGVGLVSLITFLFISLKSYLVNFETSFSLSKNIPFELMNHRKSLVLRAILLFASFILIVLSLFFSFDIATSLSFWPISSLIISCISIAFLFFLNLYREKMHYGLFYTANIFIIASIVGFAYYANVMFAYIPFEELLWRQLVIIIPSALLIIFHLIIIANPKNLSFQKETEKVLPDGTIVVVAPKYQMLAVNEWLTILGLVVFLIFMLIMNFTTLNV